MLPRSSRVRFPSVEPAGTSMRGARRRQTLRTAQSAYSRSSNAGLETSPSWQGGSGENFHVEGNNLVWGGLVDATRYIPPNTCFLRPCGDLEISDLREGHSRDCPLLVENDTRVRSRSRTFSQSHEDMANEIGRAHV